MRKALIIATSLAVIGAFGWVLLRDSSSPAILVQRTPIDTETWDRYHREISAKASPTGLRVDKTMEALVRVNTLEARLGQKALKAPEYHRAVKAFRDAARAWIELDGPEGYVALGRHQGIALWASLPRVLALARAKGVRPGVLIASTSPSAPVVEYVARGGGFIRFAQSGGFLSDGVRVDAMAPLAQGLFMDHWLAPMRSRSAVDGQLRPEERRWLHQWRVEYQSGGDADRKLEAIEALSRGHDYPADFNAGVVLFLADRYAEAEARFERSDHLDAKALAALAHEALEASHETR